MKSNTKGVRGQGRRLTDAERLQILNIIGGPNPPSIRKIAREFGIDEKAVHKIKASYAVLLAVVGPEPKVNAPWLGLDRTLGTSRLGLWESTFSTFPLLLPLPFRSRDHAFTLLNLHKDFVYLSMLLHAV